jgi:hypothetical protein
MEKFGSRIRYKHHGSATLIGGGMELCTGSKHAVEKTERPSVNIPYPHYSIVQALTSGTILRSYIK